MKSVLKFISILLLVLVLPFQTSSRVFAQTVAANTATFTLNPESGTFSDTFSVGLYVTTGPNTKVVTLRADVMYPQEKLQVVSVDTVAANFISQNSGTWINQGDYQTTGGDIVYAASIPSGATTNGQPVLFGKINFKVLTPGAASISFGNSSAIYLYQSGATTPTNIFTPSKGASYVLTTGGSGSGTTTTPTPTPTTASSGNLPNAGNEIPTFILLFSGVLFLIFGSKKLLFSSL
jgi:hypothetical protein